MKLSMIILYIHVELNENVPIDHGTNMIRPFGKVNTPQPLSALSVPQMHNEDEKIGRVENVDNTHVFTYCKTKFHLAFIFITI
jgi:hypothetical protein